FTMGNPYVSGNGDVKLSMSVDRESETEYVLDSSVDPLVINGVVLQKGTQPTRLRLIRLNAEVSLS
ncbi:MAG TPA: hypothetical protein O0X27_03795, partial [Methanocorpusculum sp.]|nr:hypothetical protein [Methanocorpusculum sp.]